MKLKLKNSFSYQNPLLKHFTSAFFKQLPNSPGVYFMVSAQGTILYIGKAKNLRIRLTHYALIKPGKCVEHILEMIEGVSSIHWNECASEKEAFARESELLHAIRPPYNSAGTEAEHYLFIGVKEAELRKNTNRSGITNQESFIKLDFQLSSRSKIHRHGYQVYGCFKHRKKVKHGYTALLRLIHAATVQRTRFNFPAAITRTSPPWLYTIALPQTWQTALDHFLKGTSNKFLHLIIQKLLTNEFIPPFMRYSLQEDIEIVKAFFETGPKHTHKLRVNHKIKRKIISQRQMDQLIAADIKF